MQYFLTSLQHILTPLAIFFNPLAINLTPLAIFFNPLAINLTPLAINLTVHHNKFLHFTIGAHT
jgi:hypothetical protein